MERSMVLCGLAVLCALLSAASLAQAEWTPNGVLVVTSTMDEGPWPRLNPGFVSDGQGGAIVYWIEYQEATNGNDILAQRIDAHGNLLWAQGGVTVCEESSDRTHPHVVLDGSGGVIFVWNDYRGGEPHVYTQHFDAGGNPLWTPNGVAICSGAITDAIFNGPNDAIVVWPDGSLLYAQRFNMQGDTLRASDGVAICEAANVRDMRMASDGSGGAIIAWESASPAELRLQKIGADGDRRWPEAGILIAQSLPFGSEMNLLADESGGAMVVWQDRRDDTLRIFVQRVLSNGMPYWTDGGVPVWSAPDNQFTPGLVSDGSGGAIVFWGTWSLERTDVFAQRMDGNGNPLWGADGISVCATTNEQQCPVIVSDGSGGAIVAWVDYPRPNPGVADVYAQHITGEGVALWPSAGLPVSTAAGQQAAPRCITDGEGGAIIAWVDTRSGKQALYAQRTERNGYWGYPAASIEAVRDVPGDQGGFVNLAWLASRLDPWPGCAISSYSVWRGISPEQAAQALKSGGAMLSDLGDFASEAGKPLVRIEHAPNRTFYWKLISTVSASHLDGYSEIVPTLFDSTAVCGEYHYFQVIAHGNDLEMYWISAPDSGRSIDNLAPAAPAGLAGTPEPSAAGLNLTWNRCCEADLGHYAVYRGATEGFEPTPGNRIAALADTMYMDGEWRAGSRYYYKVAAVDIHGNESCCSLLRPEDIAGGETPETPAATYLAQNFPNPFNPSTKIVFGLKGPEFVSLRIYDATGRLVRVLVEGARAAGVHEELWNGRDDRGAQMPSGLYFCRFRAGSFTSLRKMVLLK